MKKITILFALMAGVFGISKAQNALGAYSLSQPDIKGTARYMSMAGAFGALGGDLSSISQNPAGIGVYRSSDIGFTLDLDLQKSSTQSEGMKYGMNQTKFLLNNIGAVLTLKLASTSFPNLNFGFTYNKGASFNRIFGGNINTLHNSMSNYIAGIANADGVTEGDVSWTGGINPYDPGYDYYMAPWITTLGYNSYLINPDYNSYTDETRWSGLWVSQKESMNSKYTSGNGYYRMQEFGGTNDFNIVIGGNIANVVYWGMNFDIVSVNYQLNSLWGENLNDAMVLGRNQELGWGTAKWDLNSIYSLSGTGFNYQLGIILKPVQALRLGFAFHTPTWYNISEEYNALVNYSYPNINGIAMTNDGIPGYTSYNFRTPWKLMASAAGVIGNSFVVSFDYEWANYGAMKFTEPRYYDNSYWYDPWEPWSYAAQPGLRSDYYLNPYEAYAYENMDIRSYYKSTNTFRVGLEFKPTSSFSIRAGYSYVSSPVKTDAKNNNIEIATGSLTPSYRFDDITNYITCGLGYRYQHIYIDLAYVYKNMKADFHAYSPDPTSKGLRSPQSSVSLTNNQIILSAGYRF